MLITPHVVHDQRDARALTEDLRSQLINAGLVPQQLQRKGVARAGQPERVVGGAAPVSARSADCRRNGGFALIIVLWTLVLIGFIVAHLTASGRTEIRIAGNLVANSVARGRRRRGDFRGHLQPVGSAARTSAGRSTAAPRELAIGSSRVMVRLEDEAWWINPSSASPALLEALLRVTGSDPESARRLAAAISEWVGSAAAPAAAECARSRNIARPGSITVRRADRSRPSTNSAGCSA